MKLKLRLKTKVKKAIIIFLGGLGGLMLLTAFTWLYLTSPTGKSDKLIVVEIPSGASRKKIGEILKEKKLIRSSNFFYIYINLTGDNNLKASTYEFSKSMGLIEIVNHLVEGNNYNPNNVTITFKEGLNIRQIARLIEEKTNHTYDEVMAKMVDSDFIDSLIKKYWFLTDEIKNENIYYPLEGYLFPDTYQFASKDVTINEIVITMLNQMEKVLNNNKEKIEKNEFSLHELLTLASIVELEGVGEDDRDMIAQVFYNRLNAGWSLGSDVTACYAFKIEIKDCNDNVDYNKYNPYNTRNKTLMAGKLPVGPICNPSSNSILGSISPKNHNYFYFVADKYKKVYFTKNLNEHNKKIQEIKDKGEWPW